MFSYNTVKRIYYVMSCLFIGICAYLLFIDAVPFLAAVLMIDLFLWLLGSVCKNAMEKKENEENSLVHLMHECKTAEFIEKYSREHANDTGEGFSTGAAITLATAHMHLGNLSTALNILQLNEPENPPEEIKPSSANAIVQCTLYHNNLSALYLRRHEVENAKLHMEKAKEYLKQLQGLPDKEEKNKANINIFSRSLANRELELQLELDAEPDYEEEIERLKQYFEEAGTVLNRVYYQWLLYILHRKTGNADEAQKCREYVREHGGDTCYMRWVEEEI